MKKSVKFKIKGGWVLLDACDKILVARFSWNLCNGYAENKNLGYMHRYLKGYPRKTVDHINGDRLDNRSVNIRICTHAENSRNRRCEARSVSLYKGVLAKKKAVGWSFCAYIGVKGKTKHIGTFKTAELAAKAYNKEARKLFGEYACVNTL